MNLANEKNPDGYKPKAYYDFKSEEYNKEVFAKISFDASGNIIKIISPSHDDKISDHTHESVHFKQLINSYIESARTSIEKFESSFPDNSKFKCLLM